MSYKIILLLGVVFLAVAVGWGFITKKDNIEHVSSEELSKLVNQEVGFTDTGLIDLRTSKEIRETGVIPGATIKNFFDKGFEDSLKELDKEKTYIVYCKSGGRSAKAAVKMKKLGFKVKDYSEGMNGWLSKKNKTMRVGE